MVTPVSDSLNYLLEERKLKAETIKTFNLGFCDIQGNCYPVEVQKLIDSRFRNCTLFPFYNIYGQLISVSARPLDKRLYKYIHTSFDKKNHLYGLNITYPHILKTKKVFIVEGNFDLLTLYQNGIKNVVALLGSNISVAQICLLTRFAEEIIIAADGDAAGKIFSRKASTVLQRFKDIKSRVLELPYKVDPDLLVRTQGPLAFNKLIPKRLIDRILELI